MPIKQQKLLKMTNSAGKLRKITIKHHIVIRHIVKVLHFVVQHCYTLKELDKRCLKKRKMHLFKQNWMENKFRFFVGPFSSSHPMFRDIKQLL